MSLSITNEPKQSITITNESRPNTITWDQATFTWDEAVGTWDEPGFVVIKESKTNITITNEPKV